MPFPFPHCETPALFCNLNFTEVYINFEKYFIRLELSGMYRRVVTLKLTDVSEVSTASIIRALHPRRL
jgi:hypothetical protein